MSMPDKRIEWMRENIPGFKAMHDQAEKARIEQEENRKRLGHLLAKPLVIDGRPSLNQLRLQDRGAA